MGKLTYFDSALTNETLNPSFSQWVQEVKDDKTKATSTACKRHSHLVIWALQL